MGAAITQWLTNLFAGPVVGLKSSSSWGFFFYNYLAFRYPVKKWVPGHFLGSKGGQCNIDHITNQVPAGLKI